VSDEQTKDDNKALEVNAAEQSNADASLQPANPAVASEKSGGSGGLLGAISFVLIILLLLGLLGAGGWYGYGLYQQTNAALSSVKQAQTELVGKAQEFEGRVSQRMQAMLLKQQETVDYIDVLREKNQHLRKDWLLMESEYLIQLATYRLLFERDINTAIIALESADERLRDTGDPGILNVRKMIAQAVQELKQVPQADLAGLSLQLSAINKTIDKLPLTTSDPKAKQQLEQQEMEGAKKVESWSQLPAVIWSDLKGLVEVREHDKPIEPMLAPKERFFLIENVRLQLEQARLAMLSGQAAVYKERIATAISWISEHFDNKASITKTTLESLTTLANESIAPELPEIAYTYQALQKYRLSREEPVSKPETVLDKSTQQVN